MKNKFIGKSPLSILKKLKENKNGSMAIEIIIGMVIFLIIMAFMVDLIILTWKFSVISQTNTFIARTVGIQGGVSYSAPTGYPGGSSEYMNSSQLYTVLKDKFNDSGIEDGEWRVKVNGYSLSPATNVQIDYRQSMTTEIQIDYQWDYISDLLPIDIGNTLKSTRSTISEFKYRYDSWIGE